MSGWNYLRLLALGAIWGMSFIFMRVAAPMFGAVGTALIRVSLGAMVLIGLLRWQGVRLRLWSNWRTYGVIGLMNTAVPFSLFAWAALSIPSAYMATMNALAPLFTAVFAWILIGEALTWQRFVAFGIGLVGVAVLVGIGPATITLSVILGVLAALLAAVCYGFAAAFTRRSAMSLPPLAVAAGSQITSTLILLPVFLINSLFKPPLVLQATPSEWSTPLAAALLLGILCTGIAYSLFFRLIADEGATRAITVTFLVPVAASLWATIFLHESVTIGSFAGIAMVLFGTAMSLRNKPKLPAKA
ncbi:MAG: DMT family transporter [Burkholderiaceae bacterium]|nr:DMT family transporter [Burkholderiaceae bacterium]